METTLTQFTDSIATSVVGSIERIPPGEGREFVIDENEVAVFRTRSGEVYAVQAKCPHRHGPLADGLTGGGTVICPFHAFKFELETGQPIGNDCAALKTWQVSLSAAGEILLSL